MINSLWITEEQLQDRDEQVCNELQSIIKYKSDLADEMGRQARELRLEAEKIRVAVLNEKWWELKGYLTQEEIESLCQISPTNLLSEE